MQPTNGSSRDAARVPGLCNLHEPGSDEHSPRLCVPSPHRQGPDRHHARPGDEPALPDLGPDALGL